MVCGVCECTDDYTGVHCQDAPEACLVPVVVDCGGAEHGECINGECQCINGYTGEHCESSQPPAPEPWIKEPASSCEDFQISTARRELANPSEVSRTAGGTAAVRGLSAACLLATPMIGPGVYSRPR